MQPWFPGEPFSATIGPVERLHPAAKLGALSRSRRLCGVGAVSNYAAQVQDGTRIRAIESPIGRITPPLPP